MNPNLGNVNIKRTISKYVSIIPFDDTILGVVKGPSNKEVSNNELLKTSSLEQRYYVQAELTNRFYANTKIFLPLIQI